MTKGIERGIPYPSGRFSVREDWQREPSFKNFLKREGFEVDSTIPPKEYHLLERFFRLRCLVKNGIVDPSTAVTRFERAYNKSGLEDDFFVRNFEILNSIRLKTKAPDSG